MYTPYGYQYDPYDQYYMQQPQQGMSGMGMGMDPMQAMNMYNQMAPMWGGEPMWGGGVFEGGASSSSGLLSSAGPWAALAAVIAGNETWANKEGRRPEDIEDHAVDLLSGKVLEYDADKLADNDWVDGIPGLSGLLKWGGKLGNPEGLWEVGEVPIQWLGGLFD